MPNVVLATDVPFVAPRIPIFAENLKWQSAEARNFLIYVNNAFVKQETELPNHVEYPQEKTELEQADKELLVSTIRGTNPDGTQHFEFIPVEKDSIRFGVTPAPNNGFYDTVSDTYVEIPDTTVEDAVVEAEVSPPPLLLTGCVPTESGWLVNYIKTSDCTPRIYTEYSVVDADNDTSGCVLGGEFKNQPGFVSSLSEEDQPNYIFDSSSINPGLVVNFKDATNHYIEFELPTFNSIRIYMEENYESISGTDCYMRVYLYRSTYWIEATERQERVSRNSNYYYTSSSSMTKVRLRFYNTGGNSAGRYVRFKHIILDEKYPTEFVPIYGETYGESGIYANPIGEPNTVFLKFLEDASRVGVVEPKLVLGTTDAQDADVRISLPSNLPTDVVGPHAQRFSWPAELEHLCQAIDYTVVYCAIPTASTSVDVLNIEGHAVYLTEGNARYGSASSATISNTEVTGIETAVVVTVEGNLINIYVNGELLKSTTTVEDVHTFIMGVQNATFVGMGVYDYVMESDEFEEFHDKRRPFVTDRGIIACYNGQRNVHTGQWIDYGQNTFDI